MSVKPACSRRRFLARSWRHRGKHTTTIGGEHTTHNSHRGRTHNSIQTRNKHKLSNACLSSPRFFAVHHLSHFHIEDRFELPEPQSFCHARVQWPQRRRRLASRHLFPRETNSETNATGRPGFRTNAKFWSQAWVRSHDKFLEDVLHVATAPPTRTQVVWRPQVRQFSTDARLRQPHKWHHHGVGSPVLTAVDVGGRTPPAEPGGLAVSGRCVANRAVLIVAACSVLAPRGAWLRQKSCQEISVGNRASIAYAADSARSVRRGLLSPEVGRVAPGQYSGCHIAHKATACTLSLREARWRLCD